MVLTFSPTIRKFSRSFAFSSSRNLFVPEPTLEAISILEHFFPTSSLFLTKITPKLQSVLKGRFVKGMTILSAADTNFAQSLHLKIEG